MEKVVGVTSTDLLTHFLKRALLYFEHIYVEKLFRDLEPRKKSNNDTEMSIFVDIDYLIEKGIISELDPSLGLEAGSEAEERMIKVIKSRYEDIIQIAGVGIKTIRSEGFGKKAKNRKKLRKYLHSIYRSAVIAESACDKFMASMNLQLRTACINLEKIEKDVRAIPFGYSLEDPISKDEAREDAILRIIIHALPVPDESTPLERILEFRLDGELREKFRALRKWQIEAVHSKYSPQELSEELEYLVGEYQAHMKIQKIKHRTAMLEIALTAPFETIENLLKFKWGKAARKLFSIRKSKIHLLEAERKAPGRELAYIVKAREIFK